MTAAMLKWIALFTMIIDHIGAIFFPQYIILRYIGRISFPIFAFMLVQGYMRTHSKGKYLLRLSAFALISEIPYDLCFHKTSLYWGAQSVMLELVLAFVALIFIEATFKKNFLYVFGCVFAIFAAMFLHASYGAYGIVLVIFFYIFRNTRGADLLALLGLTYLFYGIRNFDITFMNHSYTVLQLNHTQLFAGFAAIPLAIYSGKFGKKGNKWVFYITYPVHLLILWLLYYLIVLGRLPSFNWPF